MTLTWNRTEGPPPLWTAIDDATGTKVADIEDGTWQWTAYHPAGWTSSRGNSLDDAKVRVGNFLLMGPNWKADAP